MVNWTDASIWRAHNRKYEATNDGGAFRYSGRYNRGLDKFPEEQVWPALYTATTYGVCLGEITRHLPLTSLRTLSNYRLSQLKVTLSTILDCRDIAGLGLRDEELFHDIDYEVGQALADAARKRGCEGLLVPSATRLPDPVLVIFTAQLHATSRIVVVDSIDPTLVVER